MSRIALALLLTGHLATAQVQPGQFLATTADPSGQGALAWFEPIRRDVTPIGDPSGLAVGATRAVIGSQADSALLVVPGVATVADEVVHAVIRGGALASVRPFASGFDGRIRGMQLLDDGRVLVITAQTLSMIDANGGNVTPLGGSVLGDSLIDVAARGSQAALLARDALGRGVIYLVDLGTLRWTRHALALVAPTALGFSPLLQTVLVGDAFGDVYFVNARFVASRIAQTGAAVSCIAFNRDLDNHAIGSANLAFTLTNNSARQPTSIIARGTVRSLSYSPYQSRFTTFGSTCTGNPVQPRIGAHGRPHPGNQTFAIEVVSSPGSTPAVLFLGLGTQSLGLGLIGMPLCTLHVAVLDSIPATTDPLGAAVAPLPIPELPDLVGVSLFCQWAVIARGANALGVVLSEGGVLEF